MDNKEKKINKLLNETNASIEEIEEVVNSTLYKIAIEFKDEHNEVKKHTIHLLKNDDLFIGSFYGYPINGRLDEMNNLFLNIVINEDIVTLECNLSSGRVIEFVNDIRTSYEAECILVKVFNDKLKLNVLKNNNKAIEESNPNVLLKSL